MPRTNTETKALAFRIVTIRQKNSEFTLPHAPHSGAGGATSSRLVDPWRNDADFDVLTLGLSGAATRAIATTLHLTESQVQYRLSKFGVDRWAIRNFRDGGEFSGLLLKAALPGIAKKLTDRLGDSAAAKIVQLKAA